MIDAVLNMPAWAGLPIGVGAGIIIAIVWMFNVAPARQAPGNLSVHQVLIEHAGERKGVAIYRMVCKEHDIEDAYLVSDLTTPLIDHLEKSYDSQWGNS